MAEDISSRTLARLRERAQQLGISVDDLVTALLDQSVPSALFQRMLEHSSDTTVLFDPDLRYVYVNPIIGQLTGLEPSVMIGKTDAELGLPAENLAQWRSAWDEVIASGEEQSVMFAFETLEDLNYFESRLSPIYDEDGTLQYLLAVTRDVTAFLRAKEEAYHAKGVLQQIFDNSQFLLAYLDRDFNFIQVNEQYARADDRTPDYFIGKNHFDLYPDPENEAIFRRTVETGQPYTIYAKPFVYPRHPERGITYWDWSLMPVKNADGDVEGLVFTLLDVTEREANARKIAEHERLIQSIVNTVPSFIYIYDLIADRNVFANASLTLMLGYTVEEFQTEVTDVSKTIIHPEDAGIMQAHLHHIRTELQEGEIYRTAYRLQHKDGTWRWVQDQGLIFKRTATGEVQQVLGAAVDITERKEAELQLRIKDSAVESSITPIALANLEGRLTYVNQAFADLWKLSSTEEALGKKVEEFWVSPESIQEVVHTLRTKGDYTGELTAKLWDGTQAQVTIAINMVTDDDGNPICMMASFEDITEQKQAEMFALENERLKARFQKEHERNSLIQRIISMLSHDLKTPLAIIASSRDILHLYHDRLTPEKRQEKLETIRRQVQFVLEMVDDTVNMARGYPHAGNFQPTMINLAALCQVSVEEIKATYPTRHHLSFVNLNGIEVVPVDEVLVSRILLNLLSNAIKYSPHGGDIRLELGHYEQWVVLRVIDQGSGIRPIDLPHIFDPFFRSDYVGDVEGTGLGLSIVKDCVERHRGQIYVESEYGRGSVFTVELPLSSG